MNAITGLIFPVIAAGLLALGGLAIKRPHQFQRLLPWLYCATMVLVMLLIFYASAYQSGSRAAFDFVSEKARDLSVARLGFNDNPYGISLNSFMWTFMGWVAYLAVFAILPQILGPDDPKKPSEERAGK